MFYFSQSITNGARNVTRDRTREYLSRNLIDHNLTRIIQSLYYASAGRYITSSSDSADRGCSIIRVNNNFEFNWKKPVVWYYNLY